MKQIAKARLESRREERDSPLERGTAEGQELRRRRWLPWRADRWSPIQPELANPCRTTEYARGKTVTRGSAQHPVLLQGSPSAPCPAQRTGLEQPTLGCIARTLKSPFLQGLECVPGNRAVDTTPCRSCFPKRPWQAELRAQCAHSF